MQKACNRKHYLRARRRRVPKPTTASAGHTERHNRRLRPVVQKGAARVSRGLSEGESDCRNKNALQTNFCKTCMVRRDLRGNSAQKCTHAPLEYAASTTSNPEGTPVTKQRQFRCLQRVKPAHPRSTIKNKPHKTNIIKLPPRSSS